MNRNDDPMPVLLPKQDERAIARKLRSDALQHPATVWLGAGGAVSLFIGFLGTAFFGSPGIFIGIGALALLLATGNAVVRLIGVHDLAQKQFGLIVEQNTKEMERTLQTKLQNRFDALQADFATQRAARALRALQELKTALDDLLKTYNRYRGPDVISVARLKGHAIEGFGQGLSVLEQVNVLLATNMEEARTRFEQEITQVDAEIRELEAKGERATQADKGFLSVKQGAKGRTSERLEALRMHEVQIVNLLDHSDQIEAALETTRTEFSKLAASALRTEIASIEQHLYGAIATAIEVQRILQRQEKGIEA